MENGIPNYLKSYVVITRKPKTLNGEFSIMGNIKCLCGTETFTIVREKQEQSAESKKAERQINALFEKHKSKQNDKYDLAITYKKGREYIAAVNFKTDREHLIEDITELYKIAYGESLIPIFLEAICSCCGKKIIIFDSRKHGYNGLINTVENNYVKEFKTTSKPKCRKCGSRLSKIIVKISSTGKDDLFAESGDIINDNNFEDAFDWLTVDLKCDGCDKETKKYLNLETM